MNKNIFIKITNSKIDVNSIFNILDHRFGAVNYFFGIVRDFNNNKYVKCVEYSIFDNLAFFLLKEKCESLINENIKICIFQRFGTLFVGDINLIVGVSSVNRNASFLTCNLLVEFIKHDIPIWKKEYYLDSTYNWINSI